MRIALVTRRFPPLIGGAEAMLRYLAIALGEEGADVTVVTSRLGDLPAEEQVGSVRVVRLATSPARFVGTWLYMRNLRRWFADHPIDLAYVSMLKHDAFVAVGEGRRRGFPVVLRPEGAGATGDVAWQSWGRGGRAIARRCKRADAFVAISEAVRRELIAVGYDESRIVDLPNGVPVPAEPWSPRPDCAESPHAVFVGRLAPEKGLHALIDSWPIVRRAFPAARLTLVGEGPERPSLEAQIARLGLAGAIQLPGATSNATALLAAADLFVLPSREEGMSIALLEAMALGMPLVATAIPGNLKLVEDGIHGRLAPPDDPEGLARAIVAQWSDPERRPADGTRGPATVIERYSIAAVARRISNCSIDWSASRPGGRRMAIPDLIPIAREEGYHTDTIGRFEGGQFLGFVTATLPSPLPEDWPRHKRWYAVLHRFDPDGDHLGTDARFIGTSADGQADVVARAEAALAAVIGGLDNPEFCDVAIRLFSVEVDGQTFGLVDASDPDEEMERVVLLPNDLAFFEPWDGAYDT